MLPILRPVQELPSNAGTVLLLVLAGLCLLVVFRLVPRAVSALGELLTAATAAAVVAISACAALFFLAIALITML